MLPIDPDQLLRWMRQQRWYDSSAGPVRLTDIWSVPLPAATAEVHLAIVTLEGPSVLPQRYLVPMAAYPAASTPPGVISDGDTVWADALQDRDSASAVLGLLQRPVSPLEAAWVDDEPWQLDDQVGVTLDQSNTTIFGRQHVAKVIRRLEAGRNPECELGAALRGCHHVAAYAGSLSVQLDSSWFDLIVAQRRILGTDGFQIARADAALDLKGSMGEHFPGAAYELGIAIGAVHGELAEAFGVRLDEHAAPALSTRLLHRLDALAEVAAIEPYREQARRAFTALGELGRPLPVQRIHGDLHLGQTMFTADGWKILDFEGEPRRPLAERTQPETPVKDLAGMLRSFDYATQWDGGRVEWAAQCTDLLLEGYRLQQPDLLDDDVLEVLLLDKALYEAGYESAYRPERLPIPIRALDELCGR